MHSGRLLDTDVRWPVIAASCDDRTPAERGLKNTDRSSSSCSTNSDGDDKSSTTGSSEWHSSVVAEGGCTTFTDELSPSRESDEDSDDDAGGSGAGRVSAAVAREAMAGGGQTRLAKSRYRVRALYSVFLVHAFYVRTLLAAFVCAPSQLSFLR